MIRTFTLCLAGLLTGLTALATPCPAESQESGQAHGQEGWIEAPCRLETLASARAACLAFLTDQLLLEMDARIDQTLSGLQTATAGEHRDLADRYLTAQEVWKSAVRARCEELATGDRVRAQRCRLAAARTRSGQVDESLARVSRDYGGLDPEARSGPESIEVLIPLPAPPGGPPARPRIPLLVPVLP